MDQKNRIGNQNTSMNYIIRNMYSIIYGTYIGSGINPENFLPGQFDGNP